MKFTDDLDDPPAPEMPLAFDDEHRPIAVSHPTYETQDGDDQDEHLDKLAAWFDWLDRGDERDAGIRIKLIRHFCGKSNCRTDAEFAAKYALSKGRISQLRSEIEAIVGRVAKCNNRRR